MATDPADVWKVELLIQHLREDADELGNGMKAANILQAVAVIEGMAAVTAQARADGAREALEAAKIVRIEVQPVALLRYVDADHGLHPTEPHNCRCCCDAEVYTNCPEHGAQVDVEHRVIRQVVGDWTPGRARHAARWARVAAEVSNTPIQPAV